MFRVLVLLAAVLGAGSASAADQLKFGPAAAWVKPTPIPTAAPVGGGGAVQVLLQDGQTRFGPDGDEVYTETAVKVTSAQGLAGAGNLSLNWDPQTETVTVHKLHILRGDQVIDVLAGGKTFTVLRRETNLEMAMLDGQLTANIQPEDLRVGDVIDMAATKLRHDPVFQGRSEAFTALARPGVVAHMRQSVIWPVSKPIRWRTTEGLGAASAATAGGETRLLIDLTNAEAPKAPRGAPPRYSQLATLELTQFKDWAELSALMAPLYRKAAALAPNSPLRAEIAKIKAASTDPKARTAAALKLVEDQTRYVFLAMNFGGYVPADADVTWSRRFGDCKGKTVLLLAILQELGVEAQPAVVNSAGGDGFDQRLPMMALFDHVLVRATIAGQVYWLDGTRLGDRSIDDLSPPPYRWALPLQAEGGQLEKLDQPPLAEPGFEETASLDASAGLDKPAPAHVEFIYRKDAALGLHLGLDSISASDTDRYLREMWNKSFPWIKVAKVDHVYDEAKGVLRLIMDGTATMDWPQYASGREFDIKESSLGWTTSYRREPGPAQDAPYAVGYPDYSKWTVSVTLPDHGRGFILAEGQDVDRTIAGVAFLRRSRIEGGVATMMASQRSLQREFPAAEADQDAEALRDLDRFDVAIRAPTERSAAAAAPVTQVPPAPDSAAAFSLRGAGYIAAGDDARAIADFTRASQLEPAVARHLYNRGVAHFEAGEDALALADLDRALAMAPGDTTALASRAEVYLFKGDEARARRDFDAALARAPADRGIQQRRAAAYDRTGRYEAAAGYYAELIARYPGDQNLLNARCWTVGKWGHALDSGLANCDAALKLAPDDPAILDSRGLILLQMGRFDDSIAAYDAALRQRPDTPASLYGRGMARLRRGLAADGGADLASAKALDPKIGAEFTAFGLSPAPDATPRGAR